MFEWFEGDDVGDLAPLEALCLFLLDGVGVDVTELFLSSQELDNNGGSWVDGIIVFETGLLGAWFGWKYGLVLWPKSLSQLENGGYSLKGDRVFFEEEYLGFFEEYEFADE